MFFLCSMMDKAPVPSRKSTGPPAMGWVSSIALGADVVGAGVAVAV